jgi:hypothetical protein
MPSLVLAGLAIAQTTEATAPEAGGVEILAPDDTWGGATRAEWDARWWQWAVSMPEDINPNYDTTGERCGYGQSGPVFFMPASFGEPFERTCVVAEGTAIYVVVAGTECSTVEPPPFFGRTEEELRTCAGAALDEATDYQASVNGEDVADLDAYRTASPLFTMTFPADNIFGVEPGVAQSVSETYSLLIAPPPPGEYEIVVSTMYIDDPQVYTGTVNLIVESPQVIEAPPTT